MHFKSFQAYFAKLFFANTPSPLTEKGGRFCIKLEKNVDLNQVFFIKVFCHLI